MSFWQAGLTLLMHAAEKGHATVVSMLIKAKATLDLSATNEVITASGGVRCCCLQLHWQSGNADLDLDRERNVHVYTFCLRWAYALLTPSFAFSNILLQLLFSVFRKTYVYARTHAYVRIRTQYIITRIRTRHCACAGWAHGVGDCCLGRPRFGGVGATRRQVIRGCHHRGIRIRKTALVLRNCTCARGAGCLRFRAARAL